MKTVNYYKGISIESNTIYKATEAVYDFYVDEISAIEDKEAFSGSFNIENSQRIAFYLVGLENTVIDFGGATLMFHGRIVPFVLRECKNTKLINFKVDYDRPFYTQAEVLSVSPSEMEIRIQDGYDYYVQDGYLYVKGYGWEKNLNKNNCLIWMYDRKKERNYPYILALFGEKLFPDANLPESVKQIFVEEKGEHLLLKGDFPKTWDINDGRNVLLLTHEVRDKQTFTLVGCENIALQNVTVIYGAALTMIAMHTKNIEIDNMEIRQDYQGNGRYVTNNADGIHTFNCYGNVTLRNCYMEGLLDDTVNVHNNYLVVEKVAGNKIAMKSPAACIKKYIRFIVEGDEIAVYNQNTLEKKTQCKVLKTDFDEEQGLYFFEVDIDASELCAGDVVENMSAQPEILIQNCYFGAFRGTMRLQSRSKTVVENCTFDNHETSLLFTGDTTYWYESGPVEDLTIKNCRFNHCSKPRLDFVPEAQFTEKENYYHKNITVENCTFEGCGSNGTTVAVLRHVDHFVFKDNQGDGPMSIRAIDSINVEAEGCSVI